MLMTPGLLGVLRVWEYTLDLLDLGSWVNVYPYSIHLHTIDVLY